jgi:hypothetical protein
MGVRYSLFNHTKKEFVRPGPIPVDEADPTTYPYAAFLANLMIYSWRHDHVVVLDDSGDFACEAMYRDYQDRSVELWNEFVDLYSGLLPDLKRI